MDFVKQVQQKVVDNQNRLKSRNPKPYGRNKYELEWVEPEMNFDENSLMSISESRDYIKRMTLDYVRDEDNTDALMLVSPPGVGKSYTGVDVAQYLAKMGLKVLYAMPRRNYWKDITELPVFEEDLWQLWYSIGSKDSEGNEVCRYGNEAKVWMQKRHRMMDMCKALCIHDGHFHKCLYRQQGNEPMPIIAGSHNHALTGMMTEFDVAIIDEFPLSPVARETHVSTANIMAVETEDYYVSSLIMKLAVMAMSGGERFDGYALMEKISPELKSIYERVSQEEDDDWLFKKPSLASVEDIENVRHDYLKELLQVLLPEYRAFERGETEWLERVVIDSKGIHIYSRNLLWEKLRDKKIICLDATGMKSFYETILQKPVQVVDTPVRGNGRIFQITTRAWGISSVLDGKNLTKYGSQLLTLIQYIANHKPLPNGGFEPYNKVGVVALKGLVPHLQDRGFDEELLMYQGGSRGSNKFVGLENPIDCVIVAGTLNPSEESLLRMYAQLYYHPENPALSRTRKPAKYKNDSGFETYRVEKTIRYPYVNEEGKQPIRVISGFEEEDLDALYKQITYAELTQAHGRARLKTDEGIGRDVYILSPIPPDDYSILHKVVDDLSELYPIPKNVNWWKWMDFIEIIYTNKSLDLTNLARLSGLSRPTLNKYLKYFLLTGTDYEITTRNSDRRRKILQRRS